MDAVAELLDVRRNPVFALPDFAAAENILVRILSILESRPATMEPALHAAIAALVAVAFESRTPDRGQGQDGAADSSSDRILKVMGVMRAGYAEAWKVRHMAELAGYSEPQFFRAFRRVAGCAPVDWLRHERINHAKRRLAETSDRIRCIAEAVGYNDPYYFSRDFTRLVGLSPKKYRAEVQIRSQLGPPTKIQA